MSAKILVIGLDGATWDILTPLIEKGHLPNLADLVKTGTSGQLESTYPPISPTAWTSFMTGKNPGRHGIYSFTLKNYGTYYAKPATYSDVHCPTIWDVLSVNKKRIAAINIPMTYPPGEINGIMVSGMGTPSKEYPYCYPNDFSKELDRIANGYVLDVNWLEYPDDKIKEFIRDTRDATSKRHDVACEILARENWDVFMIVYSETDRLQHRLWNAIDNNGSGFSGGDKISETQRENIVQFYEEVDHSIGELLKLNKDAELTIVLSDHGFGESYKAIDMNNLLADMGFLRYKRKDKKRQNVLSLAKSFLRKLGLQREHFVKLTNKFTRLDPYRWLDIANQDDQVIDWTQTKAFCSSVEGIYINLKNRERNGIVEMGEAYENLKEEIIDSLLNVVDPENNIRIFNKIVHKEELYDGEYLGNAPDLIITDYDRRYGCQFQLSAESKHDQVFIDDPLREGSHRMDGIIIVNGKDVKKHVKIANAKLIDVTPTILKAIGLSVPTDMDGRYWHEIFSNEYPKEDIGQASTTKVEVSRRGESQSDDAENEEILNRLKGLGYVD